MGVFFDFHFPRLAAKTPFYKSLDELVQWHDAWKLSPVKRRHSDGHFAIVELHTSAKAGRFHGCGQGCRISPLLGREYNAKLINPFGQVHGLGDHLAICGVNTNLFWQTGQAIGLADTDVEDFEESGCGFTADEHSDSFHKTSFRHYQVPVHVAGKKG